MLETLHAILILPQAPGIQVPAILCCSNFKDESVCKIKSSGSPHLKDVRDLLFTFLICNLCLIYVIFRQRQSEKSMTSKDSLI